MSYNQKKFLDYDGLVHLLGKFDDYPTNDILGTVINSIDTALNGKVDDVQIDGTSITSSGIAIIPFGNQEYHGVVKGNAAGGVIIDSQTGEIMLSPATTNAIKQGNGAFKSIVASKQHEAVFYGLSKAAGIDLANATITFGIYPDTSKAAIQNLLGITSLFSTEEASTATATHTINSLFMMDGKLHRATSAIAIGDAVMAGSNCEVVKADEVFVKNTDYATQSTGGVVKIISSGGGGFQMDQGYLLISPAVSRDIKSGTNTTLCPIIPGSQHESTFYGLAKAAGDTTQSASSNAVGTYTTTAATAIKTMLQIQEGLEVVRLI